jgi:hypothetical protein
MASVRHKGVLRRSKGFEFSFMPFLLWGVYFSPFFSMALITMYARLTTCSLARGTLEGENTLDTATRIIIIIDDLTKDFMRQ